ncbi:MAG: mechanosensitive ion channel family protein [Parachlamydiales bacterium]
MAETAAEKTKEVIQKAVPEEVVDKASDVIPLGVQQNIHDLSKVDWAYHIAGIVHLGVIIAVALALHFSIQFVFPAIIKRLKKGRKPGKAPIAEIFFKSLSLPLRTLIWIIAISLIVDLVFTHWLGWTIPSPTPRVLSVATVIAIAWFLLRWKRGVQVDIEKQIKKGATTIRRHQLEAISKLLTLIILVLTVIITLQVIGINLSALVAIGGFGTLAVGLAGKEVFANFFSGIMLYFTHPFNIGDRIQVPEKNIEGIVEEIGWYLTSIRGFDKRPIYVPNSVFSTVQVINGTRATNRRIRITLTLRYKDLDNLTALVDDLQKMLDSRDDLETTSRSTVRLTNYGDYSLEILLQAYTKTIVWAEFMDVQQSVLLAAGEIIRRHGADFAFPTTTISLDQEGPIKIDTKSQKS